LPIVELAFRPTYQALPSILCSYSSPIKAQDRSHTSSVALIRLALLAACFLEPQHTAHAPTPACLVSTPFPTPSTRPLHSTLCCSRNARSTHNIVHPLALARQSASKAVCVNWTQPRARTTSTAKWWIQPTPMPSQSLVNAITATALNVAFRCCTAKRHFASELQTTLTSISWVALLSRQSLRLLLRTLRPLQSSE